MERKSPQWGGNCLEIGSWTARQVREETISMRVMIAKHISVLAKGVLAESSSDANHRIEARAWSPCISLPVRLPLKLSLNAWISGCSGCSTHSSSQSASHLMRCDELHVAATARGEMSRIYKSSWLRPHSASNRDPIVLNRMANEMTHSSISL